MGQHVCQCYPTWAIVPGPILKNKRGRESFSLRLIVHLSNFENHYHYHSMNSDTYIFIYCYLYRHFHVNDYAFPYCKHYTSTLCSSFFIFHKKDIKFNQWNDEKKYISLYLHTYIQDAGALFGQVVFILQKHPTAEACRALGSKTTSAVIFVRRSGDPKISAIEQV